MRGSSLHLLARRPACPTKLSSEATERPLWAHSKRSLFRGFVRANLPNPGRCRIATHPEHRKKAGAAAVSDGRTRCPARLGPRLGDLTAYEWRPCDACDPELPERCCRESWRSSSRSRCHSWRNTRNRRDGRHASPKGDDHVANRKPAGGRTPTPVDRGLQPIKKCRPRTADSQISARAKPIQSGEAELSDGLSMEVPR